MIGRVRFGVVEGPQGHTAVQRRSNGAMPR